MLRGDTGFGNRGRQQALAVGCVRERVRDVADVRADCSGWERCGRCRGWCLAWQRGAGQRDEHAVVHQPRRHVEADLVRSASVVGVAQARFLDALGYELLQFAAEFPLLLVLLVPCL